MRLSAASDASRADRCPGDGGCDGSAWTPASLLLRLPAASPSTTSFNPRPPEHFGLRLTGFLDLQDLKRHGHTLLRGPR